MRIRIVVDRRRPAAPYTPYWSHASPGVVLLEDGSRMIMAKLSGLPHELCSAAERNTRAELLNRIWRDIGADNITLCTHLVRSPAPDVNVRPKFRNDFSKQLDQAYYENVLRGRLFVNDWYLSLIVSPRLLGVGTRSFQRKIASQLYQFRQLKDREYPDTSEIEGIWLQIEKSLGAYSTKRLGYRVNTTRYHQYRFSEIGEALTRILATPNEVPITTGRLGDDIYTDSDQPIFEGRLFRILPPGCCDHSDDAEGVRWGTIFSINNYMESTGPDVLDAVLTLPMALVVSQYFAFSNTPQAVQHLVRTERQMKRNRDAGKKQRQELREAASQTQGGEVARGEHDIIIAAYASNYRQIMRDSATLRAALVKTGAKLTEATGENMSDYFGQLPGNFRWCSHPGQLGTRDFSNFANFGTHPRGSTKCKWGDGSLAQFTTTALTPYDLVPFVGNNGFMAIFGMTRSGKSVLVCFLMMMLDLYMTDYGGRRGLIVMFDKDDGNRIAIQVIGGNYLTIDFGEPTGFAPLMGYRDDTPFAHAALNRLVRCMVLQDGRGPIPAEDDVRIERFVSAMLRLPVKDRSFERGRQFLGWDNPMGAGPRIEPWCRGRERGWLFDNDEDFVDFENAPAVGFNLGSILNDPSYLDPVSLYLNDRIDAIADGRRLAKIFDEAGSHCRTHGMAERMSNDFRTGGKKNMIAWLATQQPEDFLNTELGRGILDQCARMIFFPTPGARRKIYCGDDVLEGGCGCTDGEFEAIDGGMMAGGREFLLKERGLNAQSVILRFDLSSLDEWFMHVLSGETGRIKLWKELREKFPNALEAFAERSKEVAI